MFWLSKGRARSILIPLLKLLTIMAKAFVELAIEEAGQCQRWRVFDENGKWWYPPKMVYLVNSGGISSHLQLEWIQSKVKQKPAGLDALDKQVEDKKEKPKEDKPRKKNQLKTNQLRINQLSANQRKQTG